MDFKLKGGMPGMPGMSGLPQIPSQLPMLLFVLGAAIAGFGVLLLFNPWLLHYLIAGVFLVIGALFVLIGLRAKRLLG
jgi:uncharacterized membrane protein YjjP (DUF1212 family)